MKDHIVLSRAQMLTLLTLGISLVALSFLAGGHLKLFLEELKNGQDVAIVETDPEVEQEEKDEEQVINTNPVAIVEDDTLTVSWASINGNTETDFAPQLQAALAEWDQNLLKLFPEFDAYGIGVVHGGPYEGYAVKENIVTTEGMGQSYQHFITLHGPNNRLIVLNKYFLIESSFGPGKMSPLNETHYEKNRDEDGSTFLQELIKQGVTLSNATIASFENLDQDEHYEYLGLTSARYPEKVDTANAVVTSLNNGSKLRLDDDGQRLYTILDNGFVAWYDLQPPFWPASTEEYRTTARVPEVTINNSPVKTTYLKGASGGCGVSYVNIVNPRDVGALKQVGYATKIPAIKIYGPVSYDTEYYADDFARWKQTAGESKTLEEFAALNPFFYYTDTLGRMIEFSSTVVTPAGECGKPVIYLYPEETTDFNVQLFPVGGFTKTEPAYGTGWNVTAQPNGQLINYADGQTYPYLFWEGLGGAYTAPDRYWVVPQQDVHDFLVDTLAKLGLNQQETADFIEFWEPLMQDAAYYKIGFHGTDVMNQIAPLKISQEPESILRVLMDYQELDEPMESKPPRLLPPPARTGFTVIEWGGVLRHY